LPTALGVVSSGTSVAAQETTLGVGNVKWFINYGTETPTEIGGLDDLAPGKYVVTMVLTYDNNGTPATTSDDKFLTETYNVEILSPAVALTRVLAEAKPGIIINNGEVTVDTGITLPSVSTVSGVTYTWTENSDFASITSNVLSVTRMYTQNKVVLTVTVGGLPGGTGTLTRTFEFRIMPFTKAEVEARVQDDIKEAFDLAPRFFDLQGIDPTGAASGIVDLSGLLNLSLISKDASAASIAFTLKSDVASIINQGSGVTDSGVNAIYVESGINQLRVGALNFTGDITVTVIGTVSVNMGAVVATTSVSFDLLLFDTTAAVLPEITALSGVASPGSGVFELNAFNLNGRVPTGSIVIEVYSGLAAGGISGGTRVATITLPASSGVFAGGEVAASLISFNGANQIVAGNDYFSSVVLPYSLYRDSKLVAALESLKLISSTEIEAN
jgi:hypothetical protein